MDTVWEYSEHESIYPDVRLESLHRMEKGTCRRRTWWPVLFEVTLPFSEDTGHLGSGYWKTRRQHSLVSLFPLPVGETKSMSFEKNPNWFCLMYEHRVGNAHTSFRQELIMCGWYWMTPSWPYMWNVVALTAEFMKNWGMHHWVYLWRMVQRRSVISPLPEGCRGKKNKICSSWCKSSSSSWKEGVTVQTGSLRFTALTVWMRWWQ